MLKLTYTENSFYLERLAQPLEDWVTQRVILALRVGQSFCVEPSTAAFLLPADLPLTALETLVQREGGDAITLSVGDAEYVEVSLEGSWLSAPEEAEGVFVTAMSDRLEFFLFKLWQEYQICESAVSE